MRAIDVALNGDLQWRAGMANASILTPLLSAWVADDSPASLRVAGMCDLDQGRSAHVYWCENFALAAGDRISFKFTDVDNVSPPAEVIPTDSPEHLGEQRAFAETMKNFVPDPTPAPRLRPSISFEYRVNEQPPGTASLVGGEEHILCSLAWVKQRPDQCRISIRTFGDKGKPENSPATEWLQASLALNEELCVRIAA